MSKESSMCYRILQCAQHKTDGGHYGYYYCHYTSHGKEILPVENSMENSTYRSMLQIFWCSWYKEKENEIGD